MKIIEMKKIPILIIAICFGGMLKAQQLPQITQYMINNYAINPAVSGMYDYYQIKTTIRNQWVGVIDEAPRTTMMSIYGSKNKNIGIGGLLFNDETGPISRIGGSASYTYSISMASKINLSFALSGGFTQWKICKQCLDAEDINDVVLKGGNLVRSAPDATFGFNMYGDKWYLGAAIPQLLSANLDLMDDNYSSLLESTGSLDQHIYMLGAYKIDFNSSWSIEPSILLKDVEAAPLQADLGFKTMYNDLLWFGMGYRNNGEITTLLGYSFQDRYTIGYSYDIPSADVNIAPGTSHEFMIGIRFLAANESEIMR